MDKFEQQHLIAWLAGAYHTDDARFEAFSRIYDFLRDHQDLLAKGRTWSEIDRLAARA